MTEAFKLMPDPTFTSTVEIPKQGNEAPGKLPFTFRHYPVTEYQEWLKEHKRQLDEIADGPDASDAKGIDLMAQGVLHIAKGWGLPDEFNEENVKLLLNNYGRAYAAITATYFADLLGIRAKN